jgi:dTDP-4-dehydrorhamnose reductase
MKILVIGRGFVGTPLAMALNHSHWAETSIPRLNEHTADTLSSYDIVINTAAKTSIDWCEKNKEETYDTNVTQAVRIAKLLRPDQKYIFFSSACIFKSDTPDEINYEDSKPQPQCYYTETKLEAEKQLKEVSPDALIIRPRLLISEHSHPRNTINKHTPT